MQKKIILANVNGTRSIFMYSNIAEILPELNLRNITIGNSVDFGNQVYIGHSCKISDNVKIGNGCIISNFVEIEDDVVIGEKSYLHPNIFIGHSITLDANSVIFKSIKTKLSFINIFKLFKLVNK